MPFGFGRQDTRGRDIAVSFVDLATGDAFATTGLPVDELPASFAPETTLQIGPDEWLVERAEPGDRAGIIASGRLTLWLRRIEVVDPGLIIRFSLPTLEDALPPMQDPDGSPVYAMHEDDWRQHELVSARLVSEVEAELAEIRRVRADQDGAGFGRLHVRTRVPAPLAGVSLSPAGVTAALGRSDPVGLEVGGGRVLGGYAFLVPGGAIYLRLEGPDVVVLGLHGDADAAITRGLARDRALVLVDWIQGVLG